MINPLTSLRFIFAIMVFLHHLVFVINKSNTELFSFYNTFLKEGYLGVGFFFTLSGYILTHVNLNKLQNNNFNFKSFYINRIARIYPMHILTLVLIIPLSLKLLNSSIWQWSLRFIENLFLLQSFIPIRSHYFSFNLVSWSISNEIFFYLIFPFLLKFLMKLNDKTLYFIVGFISIVILFLMFTVNQQYHHFLFYINPIFRLGDFILGIVLYKLFHNEVSFSIKKSTLLEILSIVLLSLFYGISYRIPEVFRLSIFYWLPISFLIVIFSQSNGIISSFLSKKILTILGEISFGFYLYHLIIIKFTTHFNNKFHIIKSDITLIVLIFLMSLVLSYISYFLFEIKAKFLVKKYLHKY